MFRFAQFSNGTPMFSSNTLLMGRTFATESRPPRFQRTGQDTRERSSNTDRYNENRPRTEQRSMDSNRNFTKNDSERRAPSTGSNERTPPQNSQRSNEQRSNPITSSERRERSAIQNQERTGFNKAQILQVLASAVELSSKNPPKESKMEVFTKINNLIGKNLKYAVKPLTTGQQNIILNLYGQFGTPGQTKYIFDTITEKNAATYNAAMSGAVNQSSPQKALDIFAEMTSKGIKPEVSTYMLAAQATIRLKNLEESKKFHQRLIDDGIELRDSAETNIPSLYAAAGDLETAIKLFEENKERYPLSFASMVKYYDLAGKPAEAIKIYQEMKEKNILTGKACHYALLAAKKTNDKAIEEEIQQNLTQFREGKQKK